MRSRTLYWIDVEEHALHKFVPTTGEDEQWKMPEQVGAIALCTSGRVLVAMRSQLSLFDPHDGNLQRIVDAPFNPELYRFNDGRCDALGRFWVGTKSEPRSAASDKPAERAAEPLWCFERDGTFRAAPAKAQIANGIAWSLDHRTLYFTDTSTRTICKYAFDLETGRVGRRRKFATFGNREDKPDGCAVDGEGNYWVALFGGSKIVQFSPAGEGLGEIELPVSQPTMCAFGGDDLQTMYITTASHGLAQEVLEKEPLAGSLLQCRPGALGLPPNLFNDELLLRSSR